LIATALDRDAARDRIVQASLAQTQVNKSARDERDQIAGHRVGACSALPKVIMTMPGRSVQFVPEAAVGRPRLDVTCSRPAHFRILLWLLNVVASVANDRRTLFR